MYKCVCNKNYKTIYGLKNHAKICPTNLAHPNPIYINGNNKLTTVVTNSQTFCSSTTTSSKPVLSVSIANVLTTSSKNTSNGDLQINHQMEDDQIEDQTKSPQHLLSPIESKPQFTSQA